VAAEDDVAHRQIAIALVASTLAVAGCGAATPKQAGEENNFEQAPTATAEASPPPAKAPEASKEQDGALTSDQKAQMEIALRRGGEKASQCINVAADAKAGEGEVKVTFDGKIGKATDVAVGAPWAGIPLVESCIKRAFVGEYVVPFEGQLEVPYTIKLGKAEDAKKDPKKDSKKDPKKK
jgi:hypothetical protein